MSVIGPRSWCDATVMNSLFERSAAMSGDRSMIILKNIAGFPAASWYDNGRHPELEPLVGERKIVYFRLFPFRGYLDDARRKGRKNGLREDLPARIGGVARRKNMPHDRGCRKFEKLFRRRIEPDTLKSPSYAISAQGMPSSKLSNSLCSMLSPVSGLEKKDFKPKSAIMLIVTCPTDLRQLPMSIFINAI